MTEPPQFIDFGAIDFPPLKDEEWLQAQRHALTNGNGSRPDAEASWTHEWLDSVSDEPPAAPDLGGIGFLYPGKRHVFSGPQESAKTLAAYLCGLAVVRSGSPVVLLDLEMGRYDAKRRFRELGATDEEIARIAYVEPQSHATPEAIAGLVALEPGLVILDAAAGAFQVEGLDDNSRKDVETWAAGWIVPFWRAQIATLVLDHVTKNAETRGAYAIGSERKVGSADVHIGFGVIDAVKRGENGRYKMTTHKDRGGFLQRGRLLDLVLESDPDTNMIAAQFVEPEAVSEDGTMRRTRIMENVSKYLEHQTEPVSQVDVCGVVSSRKEYVIQALNTLVAEGFLMESAGARSARMFVSNRAYREAQDTHSPDLFRPVPDLFPEQVDPPVPCSPSLDGNRSGNDTGNNSGSTCSGDELPF